MCQLCVEWERQKLTSREAFSAINEMLETSQDEDYIQHLIDLSEKIIDSEVPSNELDTDEDTLWWNITHPEED